ncbi:clathrin associated protein complex large subunit [Chytriomyces hyalinus]|nr:clathrin associated protein complex large subunit [Chytriomyces hyalinus]
MDKLINKLVVTKLKDMIKSIRAAKTMADERAVIAKESAFIRTAIKEETVETRYINVQKLLYIHMLGYPAHFGQIECLKLAASPKYTDKRLGYLGIMLLLDETQETLTLVTNCLQNDMNSSNAFISGLALCTLGNISSPEMSRDLCSDVEKLLGSSNAYIRKKAALCAIRIIKKVPDLVENFMSRAKEMIMERNEASLLTGISLEIEMCRLNPDIVIPELKEQVPILVKHLKNLITTGYNPEYEVGGVTDPFLQIKILRLLRILGAGDPRTSELMNDVLAQVATTTEQSKNVGNAVLYEAVLTIMGIEAEHAVKVMAINILGKFLANTDNNIRYVALTTLTKTYQSSLLSVQDSSTSLQRHRATILACLRDEDTTLRAKALDLSFHLITPSNVFQLTRELIQYLETNPAIGSEARSQLSKKIVEHAARYRVSKCWEILVNARVLQLAGDAGVGGGGGGGLEAVVQNFVKVLSVASEELQVLAARRLYWSVANGDELIWSKEGFLLSMIWACGEYGDMLVDSSFVVDSSVGGDADVGGSEVSVGATSVLVTAPTEINVVDLLEKLAKGHFASESVRGYILSALVKLSARFSDSTALQHINSLIETHKTSISMELQARAVEFSAMSHLDFEIKSGLLERMPVLENAVTEEEIKGTGEQLVSESMRNSTSSLHGAAPKQVAKSSVVNDLLDLSFDVTSPAASSVPVSHQPNLAEIFGLSSNASSKANGDAANLLSDLFSGSPIPSSVSAAAPDPFAALVNSAALPIASAPSSPKRLLCFDKLKVKIFLVPTRSNEGTIVDVVSIFDNGSQDVLSNLMFQVAVPKSLKLQIHPPSATTIPSGKSATQNLRIENPGKAAVKLRLKIGFTVGRDVVDEIVEFAGL